MAFKVAALYKFAALPDCDDVAAGLRAFCSARGIVGTLILAREGINGTVAGADGAIDALVGELLTGDAAAGRLAGMEIKFSRAATQPFRQLKVKVKPEIVTLGLPEVDPTAIVGTYVDPADWNALISDPDTIVIDTRNDYETAIGTFRGAVDPDIRTFREFPGWVRANAGLHNKPKIAMFCTGGIRCEKASAFLLARGFAEVFHLKGGILNYLEGVPESESRWRGECFVFDERIALGHGLRERQK